MAYSISPGSVQNFFKNVSGYVPNKFKISINGGGIDNNVLTFYAKNVSLPYVKVNVQNDIYVDSKTLAKPKYVLSAETTSEIQFTFRETPTMQISRFIKSNFEMIYQNTYETSAVLPDMTITVDMLNGESRTYRKCMLLSLVELKLDNSARKFLEFDVTFTCNQSAGEWEYDNTMSGADVIKQDATAKVTTCAELKNNYLAALKAFRDSNPMIPPGSDKKTADELRLSAFVSSGVIQAYVQYIQPARGTGKRCAEPFPLPVGQVNTSSPEFRKAVTAIAAVGGSFGPNT